MLGGAYGYEVEGTAIKSSMINNNVINKSDKKLISSLKENINILEDKLSMVDDNVLIQAQLQGLEKELTLKESELKKRESNLLIREIEVSKKPKEVNVKVPHPVVEDNRPQPKRSEPKYNEPKSLIQFIATSPNKDFSNLDHIGEVITEQVPGKNIVRYLLKVNQSELSSVINELRNMGYKDAFAK